jgi:hypothetical protein
MESRYENLFTKYKPDVDAEKRELAMIMDHLLEIFDGMSVFNMAKTYVNMSRLYGISISRIREKVLNIPSKEDLDDKVLMMAGVVYESKWDRLEGATFAMSTADVLRLRLNTVKGLQPDQVLEGIENDKKCMIYFYKGLPLTLIGELDDSKN